MMPAAAAAEAADASGFDGGGELAHGLVGSGHDDYDDARSLALSLVQISILS